MQMPARKPDSPFTALEEMVESAARNTEEILVRQGGLPAGTAAEAAASARNGAWSATLATAEIADLGAVVRRAALRAAADALRHAGTTGGPPVETNPIPEGLSAAVLRDAFMEVTPGRRSPVGLHLRGYTSMEDRLSQALENFRSTVHRRAERMNREAWSRGIEAQPLAAIRGILRERNDVTGNRLRCSAPSDMAEAVNGTHFRGGREGALDHSSVCDPCAGELRVLIALRLAPSPELALDPDQLTEVRRAARARPELRELLARTPRPRRRRRRLLPWLALLLAAAAVTAFVLLR